eukprot:scaffold201_cov48-Cyclotella_meneghiniana.AAC.3
MSPGAVVGSLVPSLGGDGDRYGGRIDAADTPVRRQGIRDGVVRVWCGLGWLGPLFGGCRPWSGWWMCRLSGKNSEKRALSSKKSQVRTNGVQNHHGGIKSIGTLVKVR